ncbi:MAG: RNA polymerase-binding protein DksA [Pseudomonadota bacterium]
MIDSSERYQSLPGEPYMSEGQIRYFEDKLRRWRAELLRASRQTIEELRNQQHDVGDEADESTRLEAQQFELRTRDRYRKLIRKIDEALERLADGSYGYCDLTGEPIGLARLEARPIANLSVEAQEIKERQERRVRRQGNRSLYASF